MHGTCMRPIIKHMFVLPIICNSNSSLSTHKLGASLGKVTAQLSPAQGYLTVGPAKGLVLGLAKGPRAMAIEFDALDRIIRPPRTLEEEVEAYWSYLECPTPYCGAWLWRRHLSCPTWGVSCYNCNASWREVYLQHGFCHWNPIAKRRTEPGDTVENMCSRSR